MRIVMETRFQVGTQLLTLLCFLALLLRFLIQGLNDETNQP